MCFSTKLDLKENLIFQISLFRQNMVQPRTKCTTWNCKSEAGEKLTTGAENGDIDPTMHPKAVHFSDPLFRDHLLSNFRVVLTRERAKAG